METSELTQIEQRLVRAAEAGELLDLIPAVPDDFVDPDLMKSWGASQTLRSEVIRDLLLGRHVASLDPRGIRIRGAVLDGRIDLDWLDCSVRLEMTSSHLSGGLSAHSASLRNLVLDKSWMTVPHEQSATVDLRRASVSAWISMSGVTLTSPEGPALLADGLNVGAGVFLGKGFQAVGSGERGVIRLSGATITGQVVMRGARLSSSDGPAIVADRLKVTAGLLLNEGFEAQGAGKLGVVRLPGASIDGQFTLRGARLSSVDGPALIADRLRVTGGLFMNSGFEAIGAGKKGVVRLSGATVSGHLSMHGAKLCSSDGPALTADRMKALDGVSLNAGFEAKGAGEKGAVRLSSAAIEGQLSLRGAKLSSSNGPALMADRLQVTGGLFMNGGFEARGFGEKGVVRLPAATVGGRLHLDQEQVQTAVNGDPWYVDALRLRVAPTVDSKDWLTLLSSGTIGYAAYPYQNMADIARAQGHDRDARHILIAQRTDQLHRGDLRPLERAWVRFTGLTLGYGYEPWRALIMVFMAVVASLVMVFVLASNGMAQVSDTAISRTPCTAVEKVGYSIGTVIPLVTFDAIESCAPLPGSAGDLIRSGTWALQLVGWAGASLFVAGFTSAVRKD